MATDIERLPPNDALLTETEARKLTRNIRNRLEDLWDAVKRAYLGGAWYVLGYESWDSYIAAEFDTATLRLPRVERREAVASLTEAGLSTRQIATVTGVDQKTINNDQRSKTEENSSEYDHEIGDDVEEAEVLVEEEDPVADNRRAAQDYLDRRARDDSNVVTPQEERVVRREALAHQVLKELSNIRRSVETLERYSRDDRYPRNQESLNRECTPLATEVRNRLNQLPF